MSEYAAWQEWLTAAGQAEPLTDEEFRAARLAFHAGWTARGARRGDLLAGTAAAVVLATLLTVLLVLTAAWW